MFFWHWTRLCDEKKGPQLKRAHGLQLQERWDGTGDPPLHLSPPFIGLPAVEIAHPFHFKMTPSMLLGPVCNHDLGILLRLCKPTSDETAEEPKKAAAAAISGMLEAMGDHEYYCASYSSKDQPHLQGVLATLQDGVNMKARDIAAAKAAGTKEPPSEVARQILQRLVSSTNLYMHKGFPEMLSYLLHKPTEYSSHLFVPLMFDTELRRAMAEVHKWVGGRRDPSTTNRPNGDVKLRTKPYLNYMDYPFRPHALENFPYYYFHSSCELVSHLGLRSLEWAVLKDADGVERRQRSYQTEAM